MCYLGNIAWRSGRTVEFAQQGIRSAKILGPHLPKRLATEGVIFFGTPWG
jgi:hypothetical protein